MGFKGVKGPTGFKGERGDNGTRGTKGTDVHAIVRPLVHLAPPPHGQSHRSQFGFTLITLARRTTLRASAARMAPLATMCARAPFLFCFFFLLVAGGGAELSLRLRELTYWHTQGTRGYKGAPGNTSVELVKGSKGWSRPESCPPCF